MDTFGLIRSMPSSTSPGRGRVGQGGHSGGGSQVPSASFGKTLQFITSTKLSEIDKQQLAFAAHSAVIEKAAACDDLPQRVELLLDAVRSWRGSGAIDPTTFIAGKLDLASIDLWLRQARSDPGFSSDVVKDWTVTLEAHLRHSMTRFEFAKLFGGLFNEWLSSGDSVVAHESSDASQPGQSPEEFVEVGRKEMYEQRKRLKEIIFKAKAIDTDTLTDYLTGLFSDTEMLGNMRRGMEEFGRDLQNRVISADDMRWVIKSLLASDLMIEEKRNTLREFTQNQTVVEEIATVMTMRLNSIGAWSWPKHGVQVEMRRNLNGRYRAYTDPELLDALFLQYLGIMWQMKFKQDCIDIFSSKAWKQEFSPPSREKLGESLKYFSESPSNSIHSHRQTLRKDHFLVGQLSSSVDSTAFYEDNPDKTQVPVSHVKHELLHAVATECYLNTTLHDTHTMVCTDLEW
ncbi:hypothetical protein C8R47DRAFT_788682 [Mycena vitilis]|nr:hypothetical protein C8R47DRAFT_788682 [Mycena vitilis]